ncbi:hypothetical protein EVAR_88185_1 [Eumeta japonica]|uniref:Uncharacterized protein n=1 Tax=Eumeta variegata TaxID=151549 RepID=A0A4C1WEX9_EUMVA|nr:hypothetical protein EVAR_88185_1 [Eumeta japonica]
MRVDSAPKVKNWTLLKVYQNYQMQHPTPVSPDPEQPQQGTSKIKKAYCEPCWLFANPASKKIQNVWMEGYDDWKHIVDAIERHETSKIHLDSCLTYQQWWLHGTLDEAKSVTKRKIFWRQVLSRLLEVTLILSTCNLAFRGHREKADSNDPSS